MRYLPLLLLLASCQTWGWSDTADVLIPDEFTWGVGSSTVDTSGGYNGHSDIWLIVEEPVEGEASDEIVAGPLKLNLREGVSLPPKEVGFAMLGALLVGLVLLRLKNRSSRRQW